MKSPQPPFAKGGLKLMTLCINIVRIPKRIKMDSINVTDFDLEKTLKCSQLFRYDYDNINDDYWISQRDRLYKIRQEKEKKKNILLFSGVDREFICDFFRLEDDYKTIINSISKDEFMRKVIKQNYGMRIMRQDPWECLISYLCSARNKIPKIKQSLQMISKTFGRPISHQDHKGFSFPKPGRISNLEALRACKIGFRSEFIHQVNKDIDEKRLIALRDASYEHSKSELTKIKGIGNKIADCISLFSLDKLDSFPIDTWIRKVMTEQYFGGKNTSDNTIRAFASDYFGKFRGYANQYLFLYRRMVN
jgi:N-glycosylase/DNA lyase